jgi:hypothetical protein
MLRFGNLTDEELTKLEEMLAASKAKLIEHGQNGAAVVLKPNDVTTSKRHGQGAD